MSEYEYRLEDGEDLIPSDEMRPLLQQHWQEVAGHKDKIKLDPDFDKYRELAEADALCCVSMRLDGRLVGYFICFVWPHIHYKDHLMAMNDAIFILPEHRKGLTPALSLIKFMEGALRERGVSKMIVNTKLKHNFGSVLMRLGFKPFEEVYDKLLI